MCCVLLLVLGDVLADEWFVDVNGEDRPDGDCGGDRYAPCATLSQTLRQATESDTISVLSKASQTQPYHWCADSPLSITSSLHVRGYDGMAAIGCEHTSPGRQMLINITGESAIPASNQSQRVSYVIFENITFTDVIFYVRTSHVTFKDCVLRHVKWSSEISDAFIGVAMVGSHVYGKMEENCTVSCLPSTHFSIQAMFLNITLERSTFMQAEFKITSGGSGSFYMSHLHWSSDDTENYVLGGIYLTVGDISVHTPITVVDSIFQRQQHHDPIQSIMNLFVAAFLVRGIAVTGKPDEGSNITVTIDNCQFLNNERGVTFIGPFKWTRIVNCLFSNNIAMHAGAAILYLTAPASPSYVTNSTFDTNAAGNFPPDKITSYGESFQVIGDEVRIYSKCCKGVISFVGKGGAIRIQRGNLALIDCTFMNNTARLLGGAVFVDRESKLVVDNTWFENSPVDIHAMQGDLVYSNGKVTVKSARLNLLTAANHVAMVRHSGDHWSIEVMDISILCPVGYKLRVTNTSAYGVSPIGLKRSYQMDQLSYFCESCPRNKYSLDYGYMNFSLVFTELAYYTLLINGEKPPPGINGSYQYHDIECMHCPYGGRCQQGIAAVPNFWGYISNSQVRFQHCPKGYCCSSTDCDGFSTCAKHRQGRLCGRCKSGFSEALFSAKCVRDELCDPTWLWPVAISSGFLYALFLLFQKDIRDLMFMKWVKIKDIPFPSRSAARSDYQETANHIMSNHHNTVEQNPLNQMELDNLQNESELETEADDSHENNNEKGQHGDKDGEDEEPAPASDTGASFLIILFYYFQDAQLLHITTVFASVENRSMSMMKEILSGLFKFRVELFQFMDKVCFLQGVTPSSKLLIKAILVPYVLLQFGIMYMVWRGWRRLRGEHKHQPHNKHQNNQLSLVPSSRHTERESLNKLDVVTNAAAAMSDKAVSIRRCSTNVDTSAQAEQPATEEKKFSSRLATGFVLSLLFTYQKLATTSFTLLNCVPVGEQMVLFVEGTIACYEVWQYAVIAYAGSCIIPFCLVLLIGPGLLKDGLISLPQFFFACILPLPFLVYWVLLRLSLRGRRPSIIPEMSPEAQAVIQILQGPFKESESKLFGPTCGAGVLIGRRLVLVLLFTFVNDTLIRMLCMMLVCFIILLHHVHVLPYKDTRGNLAGSASAAALLIVGGVNLVRAGFEAAEYVPQGPNAVLMQVFEEVENGLMLWFPAFVMGLVIISVTVKLFLTCLKNAFTAKQQQYLLEEIHTNVS